MDAKIDHTDNEVIKHGFNSLAERDWVQCEVPKKLLAGMSSAESGRWISSIAPSYKVRKWLNKNCTGEWRWIYRVLGGYDRITFLCFEKEQDLFYYRLRF